jgi:protein SCO1/2
VVTERRRPGRLLLLRWIGILLIVATVVIIVQTSAGPRPRDFWWNNQYVPDSDIYQLPGQWLNQHGDTLSLADFRGTVSVVTFAFANCEFTCPYLVQELKSLAAGVGAPRKGLQFVVQLFDNFRAQPEELVTFIRKYELTGPDWQVLTTDPETLRRLADELQVEYKVLDAERYAYLHTNYVAIIDRNGRVVLTDRGFQTESQKLIQTIQSLLGTS